MTKMNPRITCIECGDKFDRTTGDVDERTCLTCILKAEDPDVIKGPNLIKQRVDREDYTHREKANYAEDIDQQAFAQGRESSVQFWNKKIHDNYVLVNDRINELLERIVAVEKEVRE